MQASEYRARLWRKSADGDLVGTWESTAQSTWSSNPTGASISIDGAPTPSPNSVFEPKTSSSISFSTTPTTIARPLTAHATPTCIVCHATATASASTSVNDAASRHQSQVPLVIAGVILSCLILVVLMVLGWLRCERRRRKIKQELENACLHHDSNADSEGSQQKPARTRSAMSLASPKLVPDANSSMRTLLPRSDITLSSRMTQREIGATRDPRYSSGTMEDCHPAFSISPGGRDLPPIPPPKHRLIPKAPPSSPTLSGQDPPAPVRRFHRHATRCEISQVPHLRLHDMSPVSPLSDQLDSPSVGLLGMGTSR